MTRRLCRYKPSTSNQQLLAITLYCIITMATRQPVTVWGTHAICKFSLWQHTHSPNHRPVWCTEKCKPLWKWMDGYITDLIHFIRLQQLIKNLSKTNRQQIWLLILHRSFHYIFPLSLKVHIVWRITLGRMCNNVYSFLK